MYDVESTKASKGFAGTFYKITPFGEARIQVDQVRAFLLEKISEKILGKDFGFEMAKDFSKDIYNSRRWRKTAKAYAQSQNYICERCHNRNFIGTGKTPRFIVHHKHPLTPANVTDDNVVYGWDNLELLCIYCHNAVHDSHIDRECVFDEDGNPVGIRRHLE